MFHEILSVIPIFQQTSNIPLRGTAEIVHGGLICYTLRPSVFYYGCQLRSCNNFFSPLNVSFDLLIVAYILSRATGAGSPEISGDQSSGTRGQ